MWPAAHHVQSRSAFDGEAVDRPAPPAIVEAGQVLQCVVDNTYISVYWRGLGLFCTNAIKPGGFDAMPMHS